VVQRTKAEEDAGARARVEGRRRIEAQAAADREAQRKKEKEGGRGWLFLVEVTIEEEEEEGADPILGDLQWVRIGKGCQHQGDGGLNQEVKRWASPPNLEEEQRAQSPQEQRAQSPQCWGEIHRKEEDPGERVLRTRLLGQQRKDNWIEQTTARLPR
jgi:hypothetical protein